VCGTAIGPVPASALVAEEANAEPLALAVNNSLCRALRGALRFLEGAQCWVRGVTGVGIRWNV
jgi:hypothetical protein